MFYILHAYKSWGKNIFFYKLNLSTINYICLFDLWFTVPVTSIAIWDVASTLWDFYPTLGCHDTQNALEISKQLRIICMGGLT